MLKTKHGKAYHIFYRFLIYIVSFIFKIFFRVEVKNSHNIPKEGRIVLCSNHISYIDPVIIGAYFPRYIYFMGKKELFENKFLASVITFFNSFPVNRVALDRKAISTAIRVLKDDQVLGLFPEGTRSVDGIVREGRKGIGLISILGESPILPMAIVGANKIIQKPHKRIFFPKIKINIGGIISTSDIIRKYQKNEAINIIVKKTMRSIKKLYEKIN